jgi:prephenate dehydrogenase
VPKRLGLIGFGQFGQLAARHLREHFEVLVADSVDLEADARAVGVQWASLPEAASCPYVVLAVPVQSLAGVLAQASPHAEPGSLYLDVGSVKSLPLELMNEALAADVDIVGTHPLFGPRSAASGLSGHRIVLCPARDTPQARARLDQVEQFLAEKLGLEIILRDAQAHDHEIAETQGLAQFVGRALASMDKSDSPVRTSGYDLLRTVAGTVGEDSWGLFEAIQSLNPYTAAVREELLARLMMLHERLEKEQRRA